MKQHHSLKEETEQEAKSTIYATTQCSLCIPSVSHIPQPVSTRICLLPLHEEPNIQVQAKPKTPIKMCITITDYECGHSEAIVQECRAFQERKKSAKRDRRNRGFWKSLFVHTPKIKCTMPTGRCTLFNQKCAECTARHEQLETAPRVAQQREMRRETWDESMKERWRSDMKWKWVCERCTAEGRRIALLQREAVGGPCCARGVDEFEQWERKEGYRTSKPRLTPPSPRHNADPPRASTREERMPWLKHATSWEVAKAEAKAASHSYGWRGERSSGLPADLIRGFVAMSGTDPKSLPSPPLEPQPLYEELGIDWDRWSQSRRTGHGAFPPPAPPPNDPLPERPLVRRSTEVRVHVAAPVEPHRSYTDPTRASPATSVVRPERRRRMGSSRGPPHPAVDTNEISPPSSPVHTNFPVSPLGSPERNPLRSSRSVISNLNHQLDDAIDYFGVPHRAEPVPAMPWQHSRR